MKIINWCIAILVCCGLFFLWASALVGVFAQTPPPVTTPWFTATAGGVTCHAYKVAQSPIRITWLCIDAYGSTAGSYTASATGGGNGTNYFYIGLNSIGAQTPEVDDSLSCLIQMNATANPTRMLDGVTLPALSAVYSCRGSSAVGAGTISWP